MLCLHTNQPESFCPKRWKLWVRSCPGAERRARVQGFQGLPGLLGISPGLIWVRLFFGGESPFGWFFFFNEKPKEQHDFGEHFANTLRKEDPHNIREGWVPGVVEGLFGFVGVPDALSTRFRTKNLPSPVSWGWPRDALDAFGWQVHVEGPGAHRAAGAANGPGTPSEPVERFGVGCCKKCIDPQKSEGLSWGWGGVLRLTGEKIIIIYIYIYMKDRPAKE